MSVPIRLPGFLRFAWMFFMQPMSLHHRLKACGIEKADAPAWRLWLQPGPGREARRHYVGLAFGLLISATPFLAFAIAAALHLGGLDVDFSVVALSVATGVAVGLIFGVAGGMVMGVAGGVAFGVVFGLTLGVGVPFGVAIGLAFGVTFGVVLSVFIAVAGGVAAGVFIAVAFGVVVGVAGGLVLSLAFGVAVGVAFAAAFVLTHLRLPLYLLEMPTEISFYLLDRLTRRSTLVLAPVLYHELSFLPHPFLGAHMLHHAPHDPDRVRRALVACAMAPGQRRTGRVVLTRLQATELVEAARARRFAAVAELSGPWLPEEARAEPPFLALREVAQHLHAAQELPDPYQQLQHLEKADDGLRSLTSQLRAERSMLARKLRGVLPAWQEAAQGLRREAEAAAAGTS